MIQCEFTFVCALHSVALGTQLNPIRDVPAPFAVMDGSVIRHAKCASHNRYKSIPAVS